MAIGAALAGFETIREVSRTSAHDRDAVQLSPRYVLRMRIAAILIAIGGAVAIVQSL